MTAEHLDAPLGQNLFQRPLDLGLRDAHLCGCRVSQLQVQRLRQTRLFGRAVQRHDVNPASASSPAGITVKMALTRQDIAWAGLKLLNEVGLNGLALRLIAGDLGVKAPTLYWHLKSKQELLDEMATQMYADAAADREPPEPLPVPT